MNSYGKIKETLDKITDEGLYNISYDDIWTYVKICEIIDREDIDEIGIDAVSEILSLYEIEDEKE